jgi:hypothetical protein
VTIGVGFICPDAIVLCSDRQLTGQGGYKYEERKIYFYSCPPDLNLIFSFAGDQDAARLMFDKVTAAMDEFSAERNMAERQARNALIAIYDDKHTKGLQTLIGFFYKGNEPFLIKTVERKVLLGVPAEYIGVGDSSVLRYICDILVTKLLSVQEACSVGSYIVRTANKYIDGCSGGPDITVLYADGKIAEDYAPEHMDQALEQQFRKMFFQVCK